MKCFTYLTLITVLTTLIQFNYLTKIWLLADRIQTRARVLSDLQFLTPERHCISVHEAERETT
jgi:hypothetical protein